MRSSLSICIDAQEALKRQLWHNDAFADPPNATNDAAANRVDRRIDRAEHERAEQTELVQPAPDDARAERFDVDDNVRKFGHVSVRKCQARSRRHAFDRMPRYGV